MSEIIVRPAQPDDAIVCAHILARGWRLAFPGSKRNVTVTVFAEETAGETVLVAERRGKVIGFAALQPAESFLHHLYVHPRAHRKGAGTALLRAAAAMASGHISLKTQRANMRARAFYAKHGFALIEEGRDAYGAWVRLEKV